MEAIDATPWTFPYPGPLEAVQRWVRPLRSMNSYGLFAVMTTQRPEIVVEGSADGETWRPYPFRWKPGEVDRRPRFARRTCRGWTGRCGSRRWPRLRLSALVPPVRAAAAGGIAPGAAPAARGSVRRRPPRYVRARLYQYRFTTCGAVAWWQREEIGPYCPPLELKDFDRRGITPILGEELAVARPESSTGVAVARPRPRRLAGSNPRNHSTRSATAIGRVSAVDQRPDGLVIDVHDGWQVGLGRVPDEHVHGVFLTPFQKD
jgi:hypothetical protein